MEKTIPFVIAVLAILIRFILLRTTHCTVEDAYITLRYAENIAHGHGFVYNPGERILGTTTPLFTLFLALASWVGFDGLVAGKALSIVADGIVCFLLSRLLNDLGYRRAGWLGAILYATASAPINFSIGGMETALVTLAGLSAIVGYVREKPTSMAICLALLFMLRIDGLLLAAILLIGWIRIHGGFPFRSLLIGIAVALPWTLFAFFYFGSPIPSSALAKLIVYQHLVANRFVNTQILMHQFIGDPVHSVLFAASVIGAVWLWRRLREMRAVIVWFVLYHAAILVSRAPVGAFGWYFVPPFPVYCAFTAAGLSFSWNRAIGFRGSPISEFLKDRAVPITHTGLALITLILLFNLRSTAKHISFVQDREDGIRRPAGEWMAKNLPSNSRVMMEAIGYVGYFSGLPILDMVGLVSPEVIPIYQTAKYPRGGIIERFLPDYLLLRISEREELFEYSRAGGRQIIGGEYEYVRGFPGEGERAYLLLYRRIAAKHL